MQEIAAPWHKASYDRFVHDRLPQLLAERLPLADYAVEPAGDYACQIRVVVDADPPPTLTFEVPACDAHGIFVVDGRKYVVLPLASSEEFDKAEIKCAGEQLHDFISERLGNAPADLAWDEPLARCWLPLGEWFRDFMSGSARQGYLDTFQVLEVGNWLRTAEHLRRIAVAVRPGRQRVVAPGQLGRVCPIMTPEGINVGRVRFVARGAEIRDGRLVVVDDSPQARLSYAVSMIPLLEHDDPNRLLMGANMMRQWEAPPQPEPALVRTGNEPDEPDFWCGRNLLTAYISWGGDTFEDAIVVSESAAARLDFPHALEPGDKLSNRHGAKGVVSRILPDEQMPHLPDGTAVELMYSVFGLPSRMNFGQVREAVLGRIARTTGEAVVVPPFQAPGAEEIRRRLRDAGLDDTGMVRLTDGRDGKPLARSSTVGWVYWGKTHHLATRKIHASVGPRRANRMSDMEYYALRDLGASATIAESYNLRSADRPGAEDLAEQVAAGSIPDVGAPGPAFADLVRRLEVLGVRADLTEEGLRFGFDPPDGEALHLACPVAHPWARERQLDRIGACPELRRHGDVAEANERLARVLGENAPPPLAGGVRARLDDAVRRFADDLLQPHHMRLRNRVLFSGRTVITPAAELNFDQLGLPDEIAWILFGPLVTRELGSAQDVQDRSDCAAEALDRIMERSWLILFRAPTLGTTSQIAFRPVRIPGRVIRLHPMACRPLNADFDGDQCAVFLPITDEGQREARELLSMAGLLRHDPKMFHWHLVSHEAHWGLAELSRSAAGRKEIAEVLGAEPDTPEEFLTRPALASAVSALLQREGPQRALEAMQALMRRGFEISRTSGGSIGPFIAESLPLAPVGEIADERAFTDRYEEVAAHIASRTDYDNDELGTVLLSVKSGARANLQQMVVLLACRSTIDETGPIRYIDRGIASGWRPDDYFAAAVGARQGLGEMALTIASEAAGMRKKLVTKGFNVLARAMRSARPGLVLAQAAATGEVDPLRDLDSRLFVGLPPK